MSTNERKKRKKWDSDKMMQAYNAVKNKEMGYLKASQFFNVPKSTLERYCKSDNPIIELTSLKMGRKPTFSEEMEHELAEYCITMVSRFYGLRASDIRSLAFQLAIKNGLPHQFNRSKNTAGRKWMRNFLKRNPQLSFRRPQATSANRAKGFSKQKVDEFNDILEKELPKINFNPTKIYNVDETGVTVVQHKMEKVICVKGQKQVGGISSAERGALITLVTCMSASGVFVPPLFIFPRVNMKEELKNGAPPGSQFACHKSGWIQVHIFTQWIVHFINTVHPSKESPVILILDGHYSHTKNIDAIDKCRENGVILICLPPHSSHRMQPLDVSFMGPFKTYYAKEIDSWLKNHPGRVVTAFQVAELVGKAYMRAATLEIAVNGFRKSGIFPFDRNHFRDHDFAVQDADDDDNNMDVDSAPVLSPVGSHTTGSPTLLATTSAVSVHSPLPFDFAVQDGDDDDTSMNVESAPVPSPIASSTESAMPLATTSAVPSYSPLAFALTMPSSNSGAETPSLLSTPSGAATSTLLSLALTAFQSIISSGSGATSAPLPVLTHDESTTAPSTPNDELVHSQVPLFLTRAQARRTFSFKPAEISPFATIQRKTKKPTKVSQLRGGKPLLVTSSPYKNELQEQLTKNQEKPGTSKISTKKVMLAKKNTKTVQKTRTIKKNKKITKKKEKKKVSVKKKILQSSSSSESAEEEPPLMSSDESDCNEDVECLYCLTQYSNDVAGEKWIQCTKCFRWCHELCAGVESHINSFTCDLCLS